MSTHPTTRWLRPPPLIRWIGWCLLGAAAVWGGLSVRERILHLSSGPDDWPVVRSRESGVLFLVGGGALPDRVGRDFVGLAGGHEARLVVIPGLGDDEDFDSYLDDWKLLGAQEVSVLHARTRAQAVDPKFSEALATATAVWLGGGQQTWFTTTYGGTIVEKRLKELLQRGGVIGGTSAGASAVTSIMMAGGRRGEPITTNGLGLFPDAIVDQHFFKRNRTARLMKLVEQHPELIGLGIDEQTAAVIELKTQRMSVVGESYVMAVAANGKSHFPRIEVLKAGDSVTFDQLREPPTSDIPNWLEDAILYGE
ncbi:MAG TPA: cyanophycinase [Planctomycetaceae bacterium]|nr:cyanophycinase [Planctomycetaceae bacterium]